MFKFSYKAILCLAAFLALGIFAPSAYAGGEVHTSPGGCQTQSATWVDGTTVTAEAGSHSESSSEASSYSKAKAKKVIKVWETTEKRRVAVRTKPNGIKGSRDCMDPEKQGLIKAGDTFWNTTHGESFPDIWQSGWKICHYREVTIGGKKYLKGTKKNCGNPGIKIPLHFKVKTTYKVVPSLEVKTYKEFWFRYWLKSQAKSHSESGSTAGSTATSEGHYTCPAGWTLEGKMCKKCPPPEEEVQKPIVTDIETINDMYASRNGEHFTRYIYFSAYPAPGESLSDLEVALRVDQGVVFGKEAENVGGNRFRQLYESPSEVGTETYWGWARSKKTGAIGESEHKTFPIKPVPSGG